MAESKGKTQRWRYLYTALHHAGSVRVAGTLRSASLWRKFPLQMALQSGFGCGASARFVSIEIWLEENGISKKLLFSGDIGNFHQPLIRDPQYADTADYVIMESTYGNRLHEKPKNYIQDFVQILLETFQRGGSVIIPSFAVGRTQELLYF